MGVDGLSRNYLDKQERTKIRKLEELRRNRKSRKQRFREKASSIIKSLANKSNFMVVQPDHIFYRFVSYLDCSSLLKLQQTCKNLKARCIAAQYQLTLNAGMLEFDIFNQCTLSKFDSESPINFEISGKKIFKSWSNCYLNTFLERDCTADLLQCQFDEYEMDKSEKVLHCIQKMKVKQLHTLQRMPFGVLSHPSLIQLDELNVGQCKIDGDGSQFLLSSNLKKCHLTFSRLDQWAVQTLLEEVRAERRAIVELILRFPKYDMTEALDFLLGGWRDVSENGGPVFVELPSGTQAKFFEVSRENGSRFFFELGPCALKNSDMVLSLRTGLNSTNATLFKLATRY